MCMKKSLILLTAFLLAGCGAGPRYYGPPPPGPYGHPYQQRPPQGFERPPSTRPSAPYALPQVASAGPVKTAQVSAYMDGQENELRGRLRGQGVIVARRGDGIVLVIFNKALFEDGAALSGNGQDLVRGLAPVLRHYDHTAVQIAGYTDTTGSPDRNLDVSDRRAKAVASALAGDGVAGGRISAKGYGEDSPRVKTGDNVSEPRNRRIEIKITAAPVG
jgi:outer membrane protein OmpA-like peptidoglycan-associated protein